MIFQAGAQLAPILSVADLRALLDRTRSQSWTGVLEVEFPTEGENVFLFDGGVPKCAYRLSSGAVQKMEGDLEAVFQNSESPLRAARLDASPRVLSLVRILLESSPAESSPLPAGQLAGLIQRWSRLGRPGLVILQKPEAFGMCLIWPGEAVPLMPVLVSAEGVREEADILSAASVDGTWDVKRIDYVETESAWNEVGIQVAYARLMEIMLARYKELTGLALLNALDRNLNRVALEHKWEINNTLGQVSVRAFFANSDETLEACKTMLEAAREHIGVVLGGRLTRFLVQDALSSVDKYSAQLIEKFSIETFLGVVKTGPLQRKV